MFAAHRVLARALEAREQAGVAGSLATARCAAELAQMLGTAGEGAQSIAANISGLGNPIRRSANGQKRKLPDSETGCSNVRLWLRKQSFDNRAVRGLISGTLVGELL